MSEPTLKFDVNLPTNKLEMFFRIVLFVVEGGAGLVTERKSLMLLRDLLDGYLADTEED